MFSSKRLSNIGQISVLKVTLKYIQCLYTENNTCNVNYDPTWNLWSLNYTVVDITSYRYIYIANYEPAWNLWLLKYSVVDITSCNLSGAREQK